MPAEFITVKVEGLKELEDNLRALAEDVARKVLRTVSRNAMLPLRAAVEALAPVGTEPLAKGRTLRLHQGIVMVSSIKGEGVRGATILVQVGLRVRPKEKSVFYGRFLEFGTVKMAARPFMRPAFDAAKDRVFQLFAKELTAGLERVARKATRKA